MITVVITHIGQSLDLKRQAFDHTIKLELPDGQIINATVDEPSVERLMKLVAEDGPSEREGVADMFALGQYNKQQVQVFGGPPDAPAGESFEQIALPANPVEPPAPTIPYPQPSRMRTVQKDEYGYPIVSKAGVDVGALLADGVEDDGVASI